MGSRKIRTFLLVVGLGVLGSITALQLLRSVPYATMIYLIGSSLVLMALEPFVGLILYLAFYFVRPWLLVPGFSNTPVLLIIGGAAFVSMVLRQGTQTRRLLLTRAPQDFMVFWLLLAVFVSHVVHGRLGNAVLYASNFAHVVIAYFLITNLVLCAARLRTVMHCLGLLMVWMCVQAVVIRYTGTGIGNVTMYGERVRILGLTGDPNLLGAGLLMFVPFFVLETARRSSVWRRSYAAIAVLLLCHVVVLTQSRGAVVASVVVGTLFLMKWRGILKGVLLGGALVAAIYFLGPARLSEFGPSEPSAFGRLIVWKRALAEFASNPVFGIGSAQSGGGIEHVPHSAFLQAAAELGLFGLVPWVLLIFVSMKNAFFVAVHARSVAHAELGLLMQALFFGYGAWIVALMFVGNPYYDEFYIMAGLCAAGTNSFVDMSESRFKLFERKDLAYGVLLIVLSLVTHQLLLSVLEV